MFGNKNIKIIDEFRKFENCVLCAARIEGLKNPSQRKNVNTHTGSSSAVVDDTANHEIIINDFVHSINEDRDPLITGESAKQATEIILQIYKNQI